jgi:hypothetical protein
MRYGVAAAALIVGSLLIGIVGYHFFENQSFVDALLNASMILGGEGPVTPMQTTAGKVFASVYALFSGVVFLVAVGVFLAPLVHRIFHKFHLDAEERARRGQS